MYNFRDVIENGVSESVLPSEALQINGEYIENLITGYRTLAVSGREALSPELATYETGIRDGAKLQSKRYPPRTIVIKYQLISETSEAFREAYNKLGGILDVEDAQLIFNDEQDKFYIGTPNAIGEVDAGLNAVVGEIEILCNDPFKYSIYEFEAEPSIDETSVLIDYNGTYKAYPTLEAEFYNETEVAEDGETAGTLSGAGDCGYVAFFTEDEKIIQLGDPDEADGEAVAKSQTLINQTFKGSTAWGTTAKALWTVNSGVTHPVVVATGSVAMGVASYAVPENPPATSGTLIKIKTSTGSPLINYSVTAKSSERTASTVKVTVAITTSLVGSVSGIGTNRELKASIYMGGAWHSVIIKKKSTHWIKNKSYTANTSFTVSGLSTSTTSLTGIKFKVERTDTLGQAGILSEKSCNNLPISDYVADEPETYYLKASSYGTENGKWHGPSITRAIGEDAAGEVGAANFTLTYSQKMCIGNTSSGTKQLGGFLCHLNDASGNIVAGVHIVKNQGGKAATLYLYVGGAIVKRVSLDLSYNNRFFGASSKSVHTSTIRKSANKVYFTIGGDNWAFLDDNITDTKVTKVTYMFEQYSTTAALSYNGLYSAKFVKNNCNTFKDIPNKFSANDIVTADCKNGEIFLNGNPTPELGALGNDWEDFFLTPGLNQVGFSYSDFVTAEYAPKIKVRYREVFL